MIEKKVVGFLGFGEAGFGLAQGLKQAGLERIVAYDKAVKEETVVGLVKQRAREAGVELFAEPEQFANEADYIMSVVVPVAALEAARALAPFLNNKHIYVDLNSCSPGMKKEIAQIVASTGAGFVEAVIIGRGIKAEGHHSPCIANGPDARRFKDYFTQYGMNIRVIDGEIGRAAAIKMLRSVFMKGIEALLVEMTLGASRYGMEEEVLNMVTEAIEKDSFRKFAEVLITTDAIHAWRRAGEMGMVIETLKEVDIKPIMTSATKEFLEWVAGLNLGKIWGGEVPDSYKEVLTAINKKMMTV